MKFAIRQLLKSPGFAVVALLTLALGIGVNTTAFTVLNRLLLQSLPFPDTGRLVKISATSPKDNYLWQAPGDFLDERDQVTAFERFAEYSMSFQSSLAMEGKPAEQATVLSVTADFFPAVGVNPVIGRAFTNAEESKQTPLVILTNAFWRRRFAANPQVLGGTLRVDGRMASIVGVMPPSFDDPLLFDGDVEVLRLDTPELNRGYRGKSWLQVVGRLKPGATIGQAQDELTAIAARLAHDFPKTNFQRGVHVEPYPNSTLGPTDRDLVWLIMDLALAVLLVACVNLANLQLVRATGRAREIAIRLALGSSRGRLVGMFLLESVLLSVAGGALGLIVAKWGNSYLASALAIPLPLDFRVIGFAFAVSAATGVFFGTIPAWIASGADMNGSLRQGQRGASTDRARHRIRHGLIVAELALTLTLLSGATYFVIGIQRLTHRNLGWRPENVLVGRFALPYQNYGEEGDVRTLAFGDRFLPELQALPGVDSVEISIGNPLWGGYISDLAFEGRPASQGAGPQALCYRVSPGYFDTFGIHLLRGRSFGELDRPGSRNTAIINQALADKFWPGEDPIGRRIGDTDPNHPSWSVIVGVVNDVAVAGDLGTPETPFSLYRPWAQSAFRFIVFGLHGNASPQSLEDGARAALARLDPDVAITFAQTAEGIMDSYLTSFSTVRRLLLEMAALGLLLSVVGIYGVVANLASERTQEVGIRMALGAQPGDVLWLFLRSGIYVSLVGTAVGLLCSFGLVTVLNKTMSVVPGDNPWAVILVAAVLAAVAVLACLLPARRATRVDPTIALRSE